jgi:hypothetical protein
MALSADSKTHWHKWYVTFKVGGEPHKVIVLLPQMGQQAAGTLALRWSEFLGIGEDGDVTLKSALRFAKQRT